MATAHPPQLHSPYSSSRLLQPTFFQLAVSQRQSMPPPKRGPGALYLINCASSVTSVHMRDPHFSFLVFSNLVDFLSRARSCRGQGTRVRQLGVGGWSRRQEPGSRRAPAGEGGWIGQEVSNRPQALACCERPRLGSAAASASSTLRGSATGCAEPLSGGTRPNYHWHTHNWHKTVAECAAARTCHTSSTQQAR